MKNENKEASTSIETPTWCDVCGKDVEMVTSDEAAIIAALLPSAIIKQVEEKVLHSEITNDGNVFICLNSLIHNIADCRLPIADLVFVLCTLSFAILNLES
jgi:hypothetical protein